MKRIVVDSVEFVPLRSLLGIVYVMLVAMGLSLGSGAIMMLPWFLGQQAALAQQNRVQLDRCRAETQEIRQAISEIAGRALR